MICNHVVLWRRQNTARQRTCWGSITSRLHDPLLVHALRRAAADLLEARVALKVVASLVVRCLVAHEAVRSEDLRILAAVYIGVHRT